jgi:2-polyprenyl-3-methyl-5-hydroxy-6-metoxy-1,4-benzoquinol methylase
MIEPQFTGERVVPNRTCHPQTMTEHLIRYALATRYAHGRILDVACGTGYGLKVMGFLGADKHGADIDQKAVDFARQFNDSSGLCNFKKIDFEKEGLSYYFGEKNINLITSFETIEHLVNPNMFLQSCADTLRDDGYFIYSIPLANPSKYHKVVYTFQEAKNLIEKYFDHELIYVQEKEELIRYERINDPVNLNKRGIFIIGICRKKIIR